MSVRRVVLDTNWRVWKDNADQLGWPQPDASAKEVRAFVRANTQSGWLADSSGLSCYRRVQQDSPLYASCGFGGVSLGPSTKGGANEYSAGYDLEDPYDIGTKKQPYAVPTGFGTGEELRAAIATIHANGMHAYGDLVLHQYGGGKNGVYQPLGYDGVTRNGRFPKTASCFVGAPPRVEVDEVPDSNGNFPFGDMVSYEHSVPPGYMIDGTVAAVEWLRATTGFDGFRVDDVKGTNVRAVLAVLNAPGMRDAFATGEYFDGEPTMVGRWVNELMGRRASVLDFSFKFNTGNICNNNSRVWMGQLADIGWCTKDPFTADTFCESADTDNSPGQQTIWNKALQYAIMLTFPGRPRVYYRDWSNDPGCYGLFSLINNLIYINATYANGLFVPRLDTDPQVFVHERTGLGELPGLIAAFNNDQYNAYSRTVQTSVGANQRLHEITGKYDDIWTDAQGRATFTVPRNDNGLGYLVFGKWVQPEAFSIRPIRTTQTFFGALPVAVPDARTGALDTPPLTNGGNTVGRIACAANSTIQLDLSGFGVLPAGASLVMRVLGPDGTQIGSSRENNISMEIVTSVAGMHTLSVSADSLPVSGVPFALTVTYTA